MALGFGLLSFLMALLGLCVLLCFFFLCGVSILCCAFVGSPFLFEFWGGCVCVCDMGNPSVVGVSIIWVVAFSDALW